MDTELVTQAKDGRPGEDAPARRLKPSGGGGPGRVGRQVLLRSRTRAPCLFSEALKGKPATQFIGSS